VPRPPRIFDPDLPYHVTTRGNDGRAIFDSVADARLFLDLLARAFARFEVTCAAYCLMTTHYHLLVTEGCERLPFAMHLLNGVYARGFNQRYGREHHVFGRRYAAIAVETERHLLAVHRYIARNPVAAGLCEHPADWRWSSYRSTCGLRRRPRFLEDDRVIELFGRDRSTALLRLREFVESDEPAA
jgi:REP element-mobilizing transposase RayT